MLWPANAQMFWKLLWNHLVPCEQSATTLEPFRADIALRAVTPQMLWAIWKLLECAAGRQPADALEPFDC